MVRAVGFIVSFFASTLLVSSDKLTIASDESVRLFFNFPSDIRNCIFFASDKKPWGQIAFEAKLRHVCKTWNQVIPKIDVHSAFTRFSVSPISFALLTGNLNEVARLNIEQGCSLVFEIGVQHCPIDYAIGKKSKQLLNALGFNVSYQKLESPDYSVEDLEDFWTICAQPSCDDRFKYYLYQLSTSQSLQDKFFNELYNLKGGYVKKFGCNENLRFFNFFLKAFIEKVLFNAAEHIHANEMITEALCHFLVDLFRIDLNTMLNEKGLTLLASAIKYKNNAIVKFLLSRSEVSVNQLTACGKPPLYYAITCDSSCAIWQLRQRPDIDLSWVDSETGLNLVGLLVDYDSVQYLQGIC